LQIKITPELPHCILKRVFKTIQLYKKHLVTVGTISMSET
jgi:hypothetical protein